MGDREVPEHIQEHNTNMELERLETAWSEALYRLSNNSADELLKVPNVETAAKVQAYLDDHKKDLQPEDIFFLQCSIEIKKLKEKMQS